VIIPPRTDPSAKTMQGEKVSVYCFWGKQERDSYWGVAPAPPWKRTIRTGSRLGGNLIIDGRGRT